MPDNISPEEKLLRLIRKGKKPDQDIAVDKKTSALPIDKKTVTFSEIKPVVQHPIYPASQQYVNFLSTHKFTIIIFMFLLSLIYLIISFISPVAGFKKIGLPKITQAKTNELKTEPTQEVKPYEFYLQGIANKQIFNSQPEQETEKPKVNIQADLLKDINLLGIVAGDPPQAFIEDKKTQKNYYVTKGQFIGELQVEDIQEGKVILNYNGQKYELYL